MKKLQLICFVFALLIASCGDDDPVTNLVGLTISDVTTVEGDADNTISISLRLDDPAEDLISVSLTSLPQTAEEEVDYVGFTAETVQFQKGDTQLDYEITIKGDTNFEMDETFEVLIASSTGPVSVNKNSATVTIQNDDEMGPPEVDINLEVDFDGIITLPPNSEASAFVRFGQDGSITNAEWTVEVEEGEICKWQLETASSTDKVLFNEEAVVWATSDTISNFLEFITPDEFPAEEIQYLVIAADPFEDIEWKYDLYFTIERDGVQYGPYFVDPKIRIPQSQ